VLPILTYFSIYFIPSLLLFLGFFLLFTF